MPSLTRKEKSTCDNYGTHQITRNNIVRHKTRCSGGSLTCPFCANFPRISRAEINCHVDKKHSAVTARDVQDCRFWDEDFWSFYLLREHQRNKRGAQRRSGAENVDLKHLMEGVDVNSLKG